ncbi:hypothetical protein [Nocardia sp. CNY236]|nr:hypothetical protein [Nocardia sp. CNY236]
MFPHDYYQDPKHLADRDLCPGTGLARLSYDQARDLLDAATAPDGPGIG